MAVNSRATLTSPASLIRFNRANAWASDRRAGLRHIGACRRSVSSRSQPIRFYSLAFERYSLCVGIGTRRLRRQARQYR
jgi:hypothetical protein